MSGNTFFGVLFGLILGIAAVYVAIYDFVEEPMNYKRAVELGFFYEAVNMYYHDCLSNFADSDDAAIKQYCIKQAEELAKKRHRFKENRVRTCIRSLCEGRTTIICTI